MGAMGTQTSRAPGGMLILAGALLIHFLLVTVVPAQLLPAVSIAVALALLAGGLASRRHRASSTTATGLLAGAMLVAGLALAGNAFVWWGWSTAWNEVVHALLWLAMAALALADRNMLLLALITGGLVFVQPPFALHGATYGYLTLALALAALLWTWGPGRTPEARPARIVAGVGLIAMCLLGLLNGIVSAAPPWYLHALVMAGVVAVLAIGELRFPLTR